MPPVCCARRAAKRSARRHSGVWSTTARNFRRVVVRTAAPETGSLMSCYRAPAHAKEQAGLRIAPIVQQAFERIDELERAFRRECVGIGGAQRFLDRIRARLGGL